MEWNAPLRMAVERLPYKLPSDWTPAQARELLRRRDELRQAMEKLWALISSESTASDRLPPA